MTAPRLRDDLTALRPLVQLVAQNTRIPVIQIEKDFWITGIVRVFAPYSAQTHKTVIWKGGTTLSKVYRTIHRFSEDVNVIVCVRVTLLVAELDNSRLWRGPVPLRLDWWLRR